MSIKAVQEARPVAGYYQLTSLSSAQKVPGAGAIVMLQAEAQNLRYRVDGVAPTASVGMILTAGECVTLNVGHGNIQNIQVIEITGGGILNATVYK